MTTSSGSTSGVSENASMASPRRSVVDETAIPVLTAIDLRPRERGREAGAGEDVPRPDLHPFVRLRVANVGSSSL